MFKPAKIDSNLIRPLPEGYASKCVKCLNEEAKWIVGTLENADVWCSYCFLNTTEWSKNNREGILGLAKELKQDYNILALTEDGLNVSREASDRILGAIISGSRTMLMLRKNKNK